MKIIIFSDVHGNLIALEQFIEATKYIADSYICLGDVVNYGPWNDECLQGITELPNIALLEGNHEELFKGTIDVENERPLVKLFHTHSMQFFTRLDLIKSLPRYIDINDYRCTPTIGNRSIYPDTAITIEQNFIIGHSHHQHKIERSNYFLINPGSVGQNRKWINLIDYLVFDTTNNEFIFKSIVYDADKFTSELRARNYPLECIHYYPWIQV